MGNEFRSISEWQTTVYGTAKEKGWWPKPICGARADSQSDMEPVDVDYDFVATKICLMHSELSEALEAVRIGKFRMYTEEGPLVRTEGGKIVEHYKPEGMVAELADVVIRAMDLCEALGISLEDAILHKAMYNKTRPFRHGGKAV